MSDYFQTKHWTSLLVRRDGLNIWTSVKWQSYPQWRPMWGPWCLRPTDSVISPMALGHCPHHIKQNSQSLGHSHCSMCHQLCHPPNAGSLFILCPSLTYAARIFIWISFVTKQICKIVSIHPLNVYISIWELPWNIQVFRSVAIHCFSSSKRFL